MPLSFIASAGTACLVEGEDEKIKIIQSPTWDELESSIASVQAVFNKRLERRRSDRTQPPDPFWKTHGCRKRLFLIVWVDNEWSGKDIETGRWSFGPLTFSDISYHVTSNC